MEQKKINKYPIKMYHINKDNIFLLVYIIDNCNFSCYYCYNNMPRKYKFLDLKKLYMFILILYKFNININIEIIGGEPTLHPDLYDFCKKMYKYKTIAIDIYTNFSQCTEYFIPFFLNTNAKFIFSWHYQNKLFIEKINKLIDYADKFVIRVMLEIFNFSKSLQIFNLLHKNNKLNIEVSLLDNDNLFVTLNNKKYKYLDEQYQQYLNIIHNINTKNEYYILYSDNTYKYISNMFAAIYFNKFKYWKCNAGINYLYIHYNGNVHKCIPSENTKVDLPFFNIHFQDISKYKFQTKPVICCKEKCPCVWEVYKERIF